RADEDGPGRGVLRLRIPRRMQDGDRAAGRRLRCEIHEGWAFGVEGDRRSDQTVPIASWPHRALSYTVTEQRHDSPLRDVVAYRPSKRAMPWPRTWWSSDEAASRARTATSMPRASSRGYFPSRRSASWTISESRLRRRSRRLARFTRVSNVQSSP